MEGECQLPQFSTAFVDYWSSDLPLITDNGGLTLLGDELPSFPCFSLSRSNSFMSSLMDADLAWTPPSSAESPLLSAGTKQTEKAIDDDLNFWAYMMPPEHENDECVVPASPVLGVSSTHGYPAPAKKAPASHKVACNNKSALDEKWSSSDYIKMSCKEFNRICKKTTTFTPQELAELKAARRRCKNRKYAKDARCKRLSRSAALHERHRAAAATHAHLQTTRAALLDAIVAAEATEGVYMIQLSVLS